MSKRADAGWQALVLFRDILKLHKAKLPPPMRTLGDAYLREEFRSHLQPGKTSPEQWATFLAEWNKYKDMIGGTADLPMLDVAPDAAVVTGIDKTGNLTQEVIQEMSPDQQERLQRLRVEAARFGWDVAPGKGNKKAG